MLSAAAFGGIAKIVFYICAGLLLSLSKNMTAAYIGMILCCLAVPVTYYFEMFKGHDIAYHILAILRSKMFYEIERLSPAKLSRGKKGGHHLYPRCRRGHVRNILCASYIANCDRGLLHGFFIAVYRIENGPSCANCSTALPLCGSNQPLPDQ